VFNSHGKQPTAATLILPHIATTTITSKAHKTRGATIGIVAASATPTATQLTIAKRPLAIDSVAAKFLRHVLRSNWLVKACQRHLQLRLPQLPLRQRRQLQVRLLQLSHQRLHRLHQRPQRPQHLQHLRCSMAPACRTPTAAPTRGVQMKLMLIGARRTLHARARRPSAW